MPEVKLKAIERELATAPVEDATAAQAATAEADSDEIEDHTLTTTVATVAVVAIGAAIADVALLPGLVLGAAAMVVPRFYPQIGEALNAGFRTTVRGAYKLGQNARDLAAETKERIDDFVAEVDAEDEVHETAMAATKKAS
jgi:hypothetical protein